MDYNKRLSNYYQRFEVSGVKYMVMCIEYRPSNAVISWADSVIKQNPDCRVIISTHYYLDQYGEISNEYSEIQPKWDVLANENKNVEMILCGHIARQNNIVRAYTVAKSGQTVAQLLIDPQQMDRFYGYDDTGVVAMLYFSNSGNDVRVELVSTARSMRAKAEDPNASDILYGATNEFTFKSLIGEEQPIIPNPDVPDEPQEPEISGDVVTDYGIIPVEYASYPIVVFSDGTVSVAKSMYSTVGDIPGALVQAREKLLPDASLAAGTYEARDKTVVILLRADVTMGTEDFWNLAHVWGNIVIDLGGHKLTAPTSKNLFNLSHKSYVKSSKTYIFPTYLTVKNGSIVTTNNAVVNFSGNSTGAGKTYTCEFSNVNFITKGSAATIFSTEGAKFHPQIASDIIFKIQYLLNFVYFVLDVTLHAICFQISIHIIYANNQIDFVLSNFNF